jgi:hypothetical protein
MFITSLVAEIMCIHLSNGEIVEFDVSEINGITFEPGSSAEEVIQIISKLPIRFINNYPNPFNPETTIQFELTHDSKTEVEIFNVKGQKVTKLIDEELGMGIHSIVWNGNDEHGKRVSSGVYFYQIKCDNQVKTKKMIMIK